MTDLDIPVLVAMLLPDTKNHDEIILGASQKFMYYSLARYGNCCVIGPNFLGQFVETSPIINVNIRCMKFFLLDSLCFALFVSLQSAVSTEKQGITM